MEIITAIDDIALRLSNIIQNEKIDQDAKMNLKCW